MKKDKTRIKPVRQNTVLARFHTSEFQTLIEKAHVFTHGNISEFVRLACREFKPIKKVKIGK